jgi:hypothetical protein
MKASITVAAALLAVSVLVPACKPHIAADSESLVVSEAEQIDPSIAPYVDYRSWHKANPEPVRMTDVVAWMCASLDPESAAKMRAELKSPHEVVQEWKTFTVFVNSVGMQRLVGVANGEFPVGTIIVKEKHDGNDSSTSELLTVMVKREKGFAPEIGDWEFLVLDGFAKAVQKSTAETCISCHTGKKANDYVFADYLPKS